MEQFKETKELLRDLQDDLKRIQSGGSNIGVVWNLDKLVNNIKDAQKQINDLIDEKVKAMHYRAATNKEIMENNRMIAKFMGMWETTNDRSLMIFRDEDGDNAVITVSDLKYNSSWDLLMPVVESIEQLGYEVYTVEQRCRIKNNTDHSTEEIYHIDIDNKLEATYNAVVWFIQMYNTEK